MILYTFEVVEEPHKQSCFQLFCSLTEADTKFIRFFLLITLPFQSMCLSSKFSYVKEREINFRNFLASKPKEILTKFKILICWALILPFLGIRMDDAMIWLQFSRDEHPNPVLFHEASLHRMNGRPLEVAFLPHSPLLLRYIINIQI